MSTPPLAVPVLDCDGYRKLLTAVEADLVKNSGHDPMGKFAWAVARAQHYAEKTGLTAESILDAWEKERSYWYMNYYQESNQPLLEGDKVRVFDTVADLLASIGAPAFRCPACAGVSKSPYECTTGIPMKTSSGVCDWKVYGLFGHMGKGVTVYVKEKLKGEKMFMPVAWEPATAEAPTP